MSGAADPSVAFYDCRRCGRPHFERFEYEFQQHRAWQTRDGIRRTTEREATLAVLRQREERNGQGTT